MNKKTLAIIEAIATITLGVLVAVFGGVSVLSTYFGILFIVAGVTLAVLACMALVKTKALPLNLTFMASIALTFGIAMLIHKEIVALVLLLFTYLVLAGGIALVVYGIYTLVCKKDTFTGVGQVVIGAAAAVVVILFLKVDGFDKVFWIIVGVLIAVYGAYALCMELKKSK